jgi:hypothetical protein
MSMDGGRNVDQMVGQHRPKVKNELVESGGLHINVAKATIRGTVSSSIEDSHIVEKQFRLALGSTFLRTRD